MKEEIYNMLLEKLPLERDINEFIIDFIKRIFTDYSRLVEKQYESDPRFDLVNKFMDKSIESIELFYKGDSLSSQQKFYEAIKPLLGDDNYNYNGLIPVFNKNYDKMYYQPDGNTKKLYRLTKHKSSMWHIPFQLRHLSSSGRFSSPGLPCLYLGDSIQTCWHELDKPPKEGLWVSCFEFDYDQICILDLTMPKLIWGETQSDFFDKAIFSWPLVALCMIKKTSDYQKDTKFYCEYLFPQYIINILSMEENSKIRAVKYFSTKSKVLKSYNIAIPTRNIKKEEHCEKLKNIFCEDDSFLSEGYKYKVTEPRQIGTSELLDLQAEISNDNYEKMKSA